MNEAKVKATLVDHYGTKAKALQRRADSLEMKLDFLHANSPAVRRFVIYQRLHIEALKSAQHNFASLGRTVADESWPHCARHCKPLPCVACVDDPPL